MATSTSSAGMGGSLKPRLVKSPKASKIYRFTIPKFGRFAYTRDPGEAGLFLPQMMRTHLGAIVREADGKITDEIDLGSGLITNIGVTALANDSSWTAETAEPLNTLNVAKYINWGTGATADAATDWKLQTQAENEAGKKEAVAVTSSVLKLTPTGNAKLIITGTLTNKEGEAKITEWGLFTAPKTEGEAQKAATSTTATSLTDTAKLVKPGETESKKAVRGAQQYIVWAKEAEEVYGLITKNTPEVATVPGWIKSKAAETGATPSATSKYTIYPVMWDHRVFGTITVGAGGKIEFPYELTIESGH
jgi:hypothetical protein